MTRRIFNGCKVGKFNKYLTFFGYLNNILCSLKNQTGLLLQRELKKLQTHSQMMEVHRDSLLSYRDTRL